MEQKVENVNPIISMNPKAITLDHAEPKTTLNKRHGSKNFFKVALFMMRGRSRKSKVLPVDDESKSIWRKMVGSMRPLHLQSNQSPPQITRSDNGQNLKMVITENANINDQGDDGFDSASEFPNSPSPASSRYASAVGLSEMVEEEDSQKEEEENVKENDGDESDGDDMIDAKADEFIAQFYQQMRLQRMDIVDRRYKEISMRSLGL